MKMLICFIGFLMTSFFSLADNLEKRENNLSQLPRYNNREFDLFQQPNSFGIKIGAAVKKQEVAGVRLPVYFVSTPEFTPLFMRSFVNIISGVAPKSVTSIDEFGFSFCVDRLKIRFDAKKSQVVINRDDFHYGIKTEGQVKITDDKAAFLAKKLLEKHRISSYVENCVADQVVDNSAGSGTYTVYFRRKVPGTVGAVGGLGDVVIVEVTPEGEMSEIRILMASLQKIEDYPIMTEQEAVAEVNKGHGWRDIGDGMNTPSFCGDITNARIAYRSSPGYDGYLQPTYVFDVSMADGKKYHAGIQAVRPEYVRYDLLQAPALGKRPAPLGKPATPASAPVVSPRPSK